MEVRMRQLGVFLALAVAGVAFAGAGELELAAGWEKDPAAAPSYVSDETTCTLSGRFRSDRAYPGVTLTRLPGDCWPSKSLQIGGSGKPLFDVTRTGEIVLASGSTADWVSLDGVSFSVAK